MKTIRSLQALGTWPFMLGMAAMGAAAGVLSWALVFVVRRFFPGVRRPTGSLLVTAILRGFVVGGAFGLVLDWYWASRP
jgi:hypothetical protein